MTYSINFSGTYGSEEICGTIPPGIYDLSEGTDGHFRSCLPATPTRQFSGLSVPDNYPCATMVHCPEESCLVCLDLFTKGDYWVLTDGIYEWSCHVINWNKNGTNRMSLTGGCDVCSDKPYEIFVVGISEVVESDWTWPAPPPAIVRNRAALRFGMNPADSCTGWYCCQENREVVFFNDCTDKNSYVCNSSSSKTPSSSSSGSGSVSHLE